MDKLDEIKGLLETGLNRNQIFACPLLPIEIPGIVSGDAFDAGDCFGTLLQVKVPKSGIIYSATFFDRDDEGSQVDLEIFNRRIAQAASDAAFAPTDNEILSFVTELAFYNFDDHGASQTSELLNIGKAYTAPDGVFYIQAVCRGTPNIASTSMPFFQLFIMSDEPAFKG